MDLSGLNPSCTSSSTPRASSVVDSLCAHIPVMIFAAVLIRHTGLRSSKCPSAPAFFTISFVNAPVHSSGSGLPASTEFTDLHSSSLIGSGATCHISYVISSGPPLFPLGSFLIHSSNSSLPTSFRRIGLSASNLPCANTSLGIGHVPIFSLPTSLLRLLHWWQ